MPQSLKKKKYKKIGLTFQTYFPKVTSVINFICTLQIYAYATACNL